jgi:hypothetical protein
VTSASTTSRPGGGAPRPVSSGRLEGIAASKIADFAGEAYAADAVVPARTYTVDAKRVALLVCLVHAAQARARDDLVEMLCKWMAATNKKAKAELEEIRLRQRLAQRWAWTPRPAPRRPGGCDASGVHPVRLALSRVGAVGGGGTLLQHGAVPGEEGLYA